MDEGVRPRLRVRAACGQLERAIDVRVRPIPVAPEPDAAREVDRNLGSSVGISK